jgi:hypothetical protein
MGFNSMPRISMMEVGQKVLGIMSTRWVLQDRRPREAAKKLQVDAIPKRIRHRVLRTVRVVGLPSPARRTAFRSVIRLPGNQRVTLTQSANGILEKAFVAKPQMSAVPWRVKPSVKDSQDAPGTRRNRNVTHRRLWTRMLDSVGPKVQRINKKVG